MRVGVIRGDLPGPVFLADLESVSGRNAPTESPGQVRYISRPTVAEVESALAGVGPGSGAGATLNGGNISGAFPLVISAANDDLRLRTSASAAFTTVVIAQASYASLALLVAAVDAALSGTGIAARINVAGNGIALESLTKGVNSYIENDTAANGSVANTPLSLADGAVRTMPSAATLITAMSPVGGALNVASATINAVGAGTAAGAMALIPLSAGAHEALADAIAPQFLETPVLEDSMRSGHLSALLSANFNPDPRRKPPLVDGPAIAVVQDDGSTAYTVGLPTITSATLNSPVAGAVTIAGTNLAGPGTPTAERKEVTVKVAGIGTPAGGDLSLSQELIEANGGTVTATAIVLPAVLNNLAGWATGSTSVRVKVRSYASAPSVLV